MIISLFIHSVQRHAKKMVSSTESYSVFGMAQRNQPVMHAETFYDLLLWKPVEVHHVLKHLVKYT